MPAGVFISFRPQDSGDFAIRIFDRLFSLFGRKLFIWVCGIGDYTAMRILVGEPDAIVAIIGRNWLAGMRDDSSDPVRIEIEAAFKRSIPVFPVLVDGASMPAQDALPPRLEPLGRVPPLQVTSERFESDMEQLRERVANAIEERWVGDPAPWFRPVGPVDGGIGSLGDELPVESRVVPPPFNRHLAIHEMENFASLRRSPVPPDKDRKGAGTASGVGAAHERLAHKEVRRASKTKRTAAKEVSRASTPSPPPEAVEEIVECSVFGPAAAPAGKTILIQVFLHLANQAERASFLATTLDASAKLKGTKLLDLPIKRGAQVEIAFSANGLVVDDPVQNVVWRGEPVYCQFLATIPAGTSGQSFFPVIRVSVDGKLVGPIKFRLSSDDTASQPTSEPLGDHAGPYRYAFVSYASKDREEVLKRVQMLEVLKTKFFQDILSLEPGDRWEKKLYENIDRCDLFLLFWSQAAKDSQWVIKEAEYALAHQEKNSDSEPDLVPVVLEQNVPPPTSLSAFHFNDRISYLISRKL
jgi:hypothetical protein